MSTIKSKIAATKFVLTTDHEVRSRIWDLLSPYRNLVWFEGPNKTQLEFAPNPGGNHQDTLAIVVANLYLAQKNDLVDIWSEDHKARFTAVYNLAKELGWILDKRVLRSWLEDAVIKYVTNTASTIIRRKVENMRYGFNSDVLWNRWQGAISGYQRLSTMDSSCSFLTKEEWQTRLDRVKVLVDILEAEYRRILVLIEEISALKQRAQELKKTLDGQLDKVENLDELDILMAAFTSTKEQLSIIDTSLSQFDFDETASRDAVREAKMLVPAETKS